MTKEKKVGPSPIQLENRINDLGSKVEALVEAIGKMTEGVSVTNAMKPEPEPVARVSGIPQKFRDAVDKHLGKDFDLVLENNDDTLTIIVPDKYSI